jgi:hypothetical protein
MGVLANDNSIQAATARLLTPQDEQGDVTELEHESPEEETLEAQPEEVVTTEEIDDSIGEDEDVGDTSLSEDSYEESEEPEDPFFTVKVDGEELEVNQAELIKGYQLEKNYTKKSQQLAAEKQELATLKLQLEEERGKYLQINQEIAQQRNVELNKAVAELATIDRHDDPIGYVQKQLDVQDIERGLQEQRAAYEYAQTAEQQQNQGRMQEYLHAQDVELSASLAGWNDPVENQAIKAGITRFATQQGYSEGELAGISSARDIIVLNKARMYDESMEKKAGVGKKRTPQKASPKVRASTPATQGTTKARAIKAKREQAKRSGKVKDAQSLMMDLMQRKPIKVRN